MTFKRDDAFAFAIPWTRMVLLDLTTIMTRCAYSDEVGEELNTAHAHLVKAYRMMKDDVVTRYRHKGGETGPITRALSQSTQG